MTSIAGQIDRAIGVDLLDLGFAVSHAEETGLFAKATYARGPFEIQITVDRRESDISVVSGGRYLPRETRDELKRRFGHVRLQHAYLDANDPEGVDRWLRARKEVILAYAVAMRDASTIEELNAVVPKECELPVERHFQLVEVEGLSLPIARLVLQVMSDVRTLSANTCYLLDLETEQDLYDELLQENHSIFEQAFTVDELSTIIEKVKFDLDFIFLVATRTPQEVGHVSLDDLYINPVKLLLEDTVLQLEVRDMSRMICVLDPELVGPVVTSIKSAEEVDEIVIVRNETYDPL